MASISNVDLRIEADAVGPDPQAVLTVTYDVTWDDYDQGSNQLYQQGWRVFGSDRAAGEDGVDDTLQTTPALEIVRFSSNGHPTSEREIVITRDLSVLNEDSGTDEIRVEVSLSPVGPFGDSAESNRILVTA
jgi:hypothetical protein